MSRRTVIIVSVGSAISILVGIFFATALFIQQHYQNRVYSGVLVGETSLAGLTKLEVINFIENINNRLTKEGIDLLVMDKAGKKHSVHISLALGGDSSGDLIRFDSEAAAEQVIKAGRGGSFLQKLTAPLMFRFFKPAIFQAPVIIDQRNLVDLIRSSLKQFEDEPRNASIIFNHGSLEEPEIINEKVGSIFNYPSLVEDIQKSLSRLSFEPVPAKLNQFLPTITRTDVLSFAPEVEKLKPLGNIVFNLPSSSSTAPASFIVSPNEWRVWMEIQRESVSNKLIFGFNQNKVTNFLETTIRPLVDIEAREARFAIRGERVEEFTNSRSGQSLDSTVTFTTLNAAWQQNVENQIATTTVTVAVNEVKPTVSTAEVNSFGISQIIGVGTSTFRDSHTNRIKNIARAVERLNGILIKPGEIFSTLKGAGPFSAENGFLPEMVIKGKEIKPEIGGGMCQIGTTLFRMAMNSGMPITERKNHSLVVGYYADPVNGNPGTDATVYEPNLDFKFLNDTGNYLLLQTNIDYKKQMLTFTLWGTPDGRKGWYNHPKVSKWIPAGDPEEVIVTDGKLKPGERKCQNAFRGAVASFTYSRVTTSSQQIDQVFTSYYRPLPQICMIGADPGTVSSTVTGEPLPTSVPLDVSPN